MGNPEHEDPHTRGDVFLAITAQLNGKKEIGEGFLSLAKRSFIQSVLGETITEMGILVSLLE